MFGLNIGNFKANLDPLEPNKLIIKMPNGAVVRIQHNTNGRFTWVSFIDPEYQSPTDSQVFLQVMTDPALREWTVSDFVFDDNGNLVFRPDMLKGQYLSKQQEKD